MFLLPDLVFANTHKHSLMLIFKSILAIQEKKRESVQCYWQVDYIIQAEPYTPWSLTAAERCREGLDVGWGFVLIYLAEKERKTEMFVSSKDNSVRQASLKVQLDERSVWKLSNNKYKHTKKYTYSCILWDICTHANVRIRNQNQYPSRNL